MSAIARDDLLTRLAGVVGEERAAEIVAETARAIGADAGAEDGVTRIVDRLAESKGAIGATVRLLRSRARTTAMRPPAAGAHDEPTGRRAVPDHPNVRRLVSLLAPALGEERATELVESRILSLGLERRRLGSAPALAILESLATEPGLTGTVARFAKARAHLEMVD